MDRKNRTSYHHGNLREALLQSARILLEEQGISALKLRSITAHAGVSATAAAPHFGNLAGLLSALAARGYEELATDMSADKARSPRDVGLAYVRYAIANPGLFTLMFRNDVIDRNNPEYISASAKAFGCLENLSTHISNADNSESAKNTSDIPIMAALWGKVHGLAILAINGELQELASCAMPPLSLDSLIEQSL